MTTMTNKLSLTLAFALLRAGVGYAADSYVGTVFDLTNALAGASSGDTVWCSNGTYTATAPMGVGKFLDIVAGVTVRSISGNPADVVLDADDQWRVAEVNNGSWLRGVTVTNGLSDGYGGGVYGGEAGGALSNCVLSGNQGDLGGGAVMVTLYNCTISGNKATSNGGGAEECVLYNCILSGNSTTNESGLGAGGGAFMSTLYNCLLTKNSARDGGGVVLCDLYNCTLSENVGVNGGGVADSTIYNSISWGNNVADYPNTVSYFSCGIGLTNNASITNDPLFVSGAYRLQKTSPCIDTGTNQAWMVGAKDLAGKDRIRGSAADMGAYEWYPVISLSASGLTNIRASSITAARGQVE